MKKLGKKKLFIFLGVVVVLLVIVVINLRKSSGGKVKVQTDKVTRGSITASVSGSAKIQPEVQVKISAKVSGQIMELGVQEGDDVNKGDFLVQLDPEFYRAAVEQAKSNLDYAKAGHEKALNEYERSKKLFADNLISNAELEIAKSTYEQANAQVDQMQAVLNQAKDNLSKTTIYSPMEGVVSQLNKKVGEMAMGSQFTLDVIMVVADLTKMLAETEIDENDVVSVSFGDTAKITVDAFPDSLFNGVVKEIANTGLTRGQGTQEEVTNFLVKVSMLEKPSGLRPGMSATVDVLTQTNEDALKIPIQCVTVRSPLKPEEEKEVDGSESEDTDEEKEEKSKSNEDEEPIRVVFVVKDGVASQVAVETGISSDTEWEIIEGLEEGDEVVSGSYRVLSKQLKDGDEVKVDNSLKKYGREEE
jgi:HlyD family secretion protein